MLDPPGSVSGKLRALFGIELLDGSHQANVSFVDEIEQRQPIAFIVTGNLHDKPQVCLNHVFTSFQVAFLDASGQLDFLLGCQEFRLADFTHVQVKGRVAGVPNGFRRS